MPGQLQGRNAIVTGGGSGIGRATALRFAREGASVVVADIDSRRANDVAAAMTAAGASAIAIAVDVSQPDSVTEMHRVASETLGPIDILVNNAGLSLGNDILTIEPETWDLNLDIVLKSVFLCSKAVLPGMIERGRGAIVNVSSVNGLGGYGEEAYAAAKAGMVSLTQNIAVRYGRRGVRVNCVAPGTIRTPIWNERVERDPGVFERLSRWYPLQRVGDPEDVANAILFLASDEAAWITGVVLPVDGGLVAGNGLIGGEIPY